MNTYGFLSVVRPVNYYDGGDYIWGTGTCFFVRFQNDAYLITAEHVFASAAPDFPKLHVWLRDSRECVKFQGCWRYVRKTDSREEKEDIVALRVCRASVHYDQIMRQAILLPNQVCLTDELNLGDRLFVCGYPSETKEYDSAGVTFVDELLFRDGVYRGAYNGVHRVDCLPTFHRLDGMSGSPIFLEKNGRALLVGLFVAAASDGSVMHFLPIEDVFSLIAKAPKYSSLLSGQPN